MPSERNFANKHNRTEKCQRDTRTVAARQKTPISSREKEYFFAGQDDLYNQMRKKCRQHSTASPRLLRMLRICTARIQKRPSICERIETQVSHALRPNMKGTKSVENKTILPFVITFGFFVELAQHFSATRTTVASRRFTEHVARSECAKSKKRTLQRRRFAGYA